MSLEPSGAVAVGPHTVRLLRDGAQAYPAMLAAIAAAEREILLEMYWIGGDRVGDAFRSALVERARAGVRVAVVFDAIGSFDTPRSFFAPLVEAGVEVQEFGPVSPFVSRFRVAGIANRDHRKILVVDGRVGFVGGINLGESWAPPDHPERAFRDDAVEIRGPAVAALRMVCLEMLERLGSPAAAPASLRSVDTRVRILANRLGPRAGGTIRRAYLYGLRRATRSVDIACAYFLPGPVFVRAMRGAARRGARVRVLVSRESDVRIVALAMQSTLRRLRAEGVEVYEYEPRVLHSKTAVFDGRYTFIGSHNLDALSAWYNLECDAVIDSPDFARVVTTAFEDDLEASTRLAVDAWSRRSFGVRSLGWVAAHLRGFL